MTQHDFKKRYVFNIKTDNIGGGSFGTVYKAYDTILDKEVAIKVSEVKNIGDKEFSLLEEYKAIENLSEHQNIANYEKVYRFESFPTFFDYGIMQYYSLGNLSHYLKNNEVSLEKREHITRGILEGIAFLHEHKVVHRDLKPSNVLVVDRRGQIIPKITDFGLSKQAEADGKASRFTNSFAGGTLQYSSPEQLKGLPLKLNTDLWSFGAIAYEILTQKTLFEADSQGTASAEWQNAITQKILHSDVSKELESLSAKWRKVVTACLERDVNKRIQDSSSLFSILNGKETSIEVGKETLGREPKKIIVQKVALDAPTIIKGKESEVKRQEPKTKKEKLKIERIQVKAQKRELKSKKWIPIVALGVIFVVAVYFLWPTTSPEKKAWKNATQENKKELFNNYLKTYPKGLYITQAKELIKNLEEIAIIRKNKVADSTAWVKTVKQNTVKHYNSYIDSFPKGSKVNEAESILDKLALSTWQSTKNKNTVNALRSYQKQFPQSVYTTSANNILKTLSWEKTFGGKDYDSANSIVQTDDGGYATIGWSKLNGNFDFWLIKVDNKGVKQWDKTFGGTASDTPSSLIQTFDGGYILFGDTASKGAGNSDFWLIKVNNKGVKQWDKTFGGEKGDYSRSIIQTIDGGYLLLGLTRSKGIKGDFWLIKVNNKGIKQWDKTFGGSGQDSPNSIIQTEDNGYMLAGSTTSKGAGKGDSWLIKINSKGIKQWDKAFGSSEDDNLRSIIQTVNGDYVAAGWSRLKGAGMPDSWLIKFNSIGVKQWEKTFGGKNWDSTNSAIQTTDGGYMLAGNTHSKGSGKSDFWLIKTNSRGVKQWDKIFGGKESDDANSIIQTKDGGYIVAGRTSSKSTGESDFWLIKIDNKGGL